MMSDSRSGPGDDMAQPSIESARDTAFKTPAQLAIHGGSTVDEYAERAVAIQQAATTHEIDAIVSVFTVQTADLGTAQLEAPESFVTIITAFGGASVIAPQGVSLDISGFALFGGRNDNRADRSPFPGSP